MLLRGHGHSSLRLRQPSDSHSPCKPFHRSNHGSHMPSSWRLQAAEVKETSVQHVSKSSTLESSVDEATKTSTVDYLRSVGIEPVTAEQLFDKHHVDKWTPQLLAYFPLGCALAAIRFSAWIAGIAADQPWFRNMSVINAYMALLGVKVVWKHVHHIPSNQRHVLVSNHTTVGDLLMLFQRPQRYIHLITNALPEPVYATQHLPAILQPANKGVYMQIAEQSQRAQQQLQHHAVNGASLAGGQQTAPSSNCNMQHPSTSTSSNSSTSACSSSSSSSEAQEASIHLFPEGGMTNGAGMMRFSRGFMLFADKLPVVPVALRVKTAFPEINSHTATSSFLANLFWFSFQPWTVLEATALPPMQLQPGESKAAFVQRVQLAIAEELGSWVTDLSIQQKRQLVQKKQKKQRRKRQASP